jgi:N-acetylated-alpha-linked acidic dipeptidase
MVISQTSDHTQWSDAETETAFLSELSLDAPWPVVERFATLHRLSGSDDEERALQMLVDHLESWGVPYTLHRPVCFISIPLAATARLVADGKSGTSIRAKTSAMSVSTDGREIEGELLYVRAKTGDTPGDVISASVDLGDVDASGKIVITEGLPFPGMVAAVTNAGAAAGIFIAPGHNIHETICTPIWGTPDLDSAPRQPVLPVIAVNRDDGDTLIEFASSGGSIAISTTLDTRWRPIPVLVAEIPGSSFPDEFVLLHGHLDSWHTGVGDNATGDAMMLEIARVAWKMRDRINRSLRVAWWSGHSHGRYAGSTWYADTFAIDLAKNCVAQVNCDSPGCRWATTYNDLTAMSETEPFVHGVIKQVTGITPETERPPRAGDYSFNSIGLSSFYMLSSTMTDEARAEKGYYPVGGCGGNIAWHTEDDVLEIADRDTFLRDLQVYGASILRTLNAPVHPFDWRHVTADFRRTLERYQAGAADAFDLRPALKAVDELETALDGFYASLPTGQIDHDQARSVNRIQRRLGRILVQVNYSRMPPFWHDPALNVPPLPDLAPALTIPGLSSDDERLQIVRTHLLRGRNRLVWALTTAREVVEERIAN